MTGGILSNYKLHVVRKSKRLHLKMIPRFTDTLGLVVHLVLFVSL